MKENESIPEENHKLDDIGIVEFNPSPIKFKNLRVGDIFMWASDYEFEKQHYLERPDQHKELESCCFSLKISKDSCYNVEYQELFPGEPDDECIFIPAKLQFYHIIAFHDLNIGEMFSNPGFNLFKRNKKNIYLKDGLQTAFVFNENDDITIQEYDMICPRRVLFKSY